MQRDGTFTGGLKTLHDRFWKHYLYQTGDRELLRVAPPFLAFRGLVMASPLWYPSLSDVIRRKLLNFIFAVLEADCFDPSQAGAYCDKTIQ